MRLPIFDRLDGYSLADALAVAYDAVPAEQGFLFVVGYLDVPDFISADKLVEGGTYGK